MQIDRNLNLVVPVERADEVVVYTHTSPLSKEAFDNNFMIIAKTFTTIYSEGYGVIAGPRIAAKLLRKVAADMGQTQYAENGVIAEMRRLTNVMAPGDRGWVTVPLEVGIQQGMISAEEADEAENAVAFFIVASCMHRRKEAKAVLEQAASLWDAQISSLNATAFSASLPTSTKPASTGAKAPPLSIPS